MATAGEILREARVARGFTIDDIEEKLNIRSKYIFALESEDFDALPGKAYVLGYVKNYARFLMLDTEALVAEVREKIDVADAMAMTTIELAPVSPPQKIEIEIEKAPPPPKKESGPPSPQKAEGKPKEKVKREKDNSKPKRSNRREKGTQANFRILYLMLGLLLLLGFLAFLGTRNWGI